MTTSKYSGSCHCGAVAFEVELDLADALQCNCSICSRLGAVWAFAPSTRLQMRSDAAALGDYQFGARRLHHRHCTRCGIETFAEGVMPDGTPSVGVNLRCLDGVEVDKPPPRQFDGRSL